MTGSPSAAVWPRPLPKPRLDRLAASWCSHFSRLRSLSTQTRRSVKSSLPMSSTPLPAQQPAQERPPVLLVAPQASTWRSTSTLKSNASLEKRLELAGLTAVLEENSRMHKRASNLLTSHREIDDCVEIKTSSFVAIIPFRNFGLYSERWR